MLILPEYGEVSFEWDEEKNIENEKKHGITFETAQLAFYDSNRIITQDTAHSEKELRFFCFGLVEEKVLTVRFTYRRTKIRIIGAG